MDRTSNILSRALAKLKLAQSQLIEESQVLDELKEHEEAAECELGILRSEISAKDAKIASLNEQLEKREEEARNLSRELIGKTGEFKAALERERTGFKLNYEKLEATAALGEKGLLSEVESLRDSLSQKAAEAARSGAEIQNLMSRNEALRDDCERRLLELETVNASLSEGVKKHKKGTEALFCEIRSQAAEFNAVIDSERAEARPAGAKAQKEILDLNTSLKNLHGELARLTMENAKLGEENSRLKALQEAGLVKIIELEMFAKSAASALKENKSELDITKAHMKDVSDEMSKDKADSRRRLAIVRLELDEKNRELSRLTRELDAARAEKKALRPNHPLNSGTH